MREQIDQYKYDRTDRQRMDKGDDGNGFSFGWQLAFCAWRPKQNLQSCKLVLSRSNGLL